LFNSMTMIFEAPAMGAPLMALSPTPPPPKMTTVSPPHVGGI